MSHPQPPEIDRSATAIKARLDVFEKLRQELERDYEHLGTKTWGDVTEHPDLPELYDKLQEVLRK